MRLRLNIRTSDFKEKITVVLRESSDSNAMNEDGLPIDFQETKIDTRACVKWNYSKEIDTMEKEANFQKVDFFIKKRKALKSLNFEDKILFDGRVFNIEYVNKYDDVFEVRGVCYSETNR